MIRLFLKFSVGSWAAAGLSILTLPIVTALIRPDEFGRAAMFSLAVGLISQLLMLGTDQSFVRDYFARDGVTDKAALLRETLVAPAMLSLVAGIVVILFAGPITAQLFGSADEFSAFLLAAAILLVPVERFAMLVLRMGKQALAFSLLRFLFALSNFVVTFVYAWTIGRSFHAIALAQVMGLAIGALVAILLARGHWSLGTTSRAGIRGALAYGLPFVPTFAAMWIVEGIDKLALRHFADFTQLGIFSAAYRFIALVALLQVGFSTFWVPVSYEMYERDPAEARATFSSSVQLMVPVLLSGGFAVLMAKDLIALLFAHDYRDAAHVMPFLLFVPIMYALSEVTSAGISLRRQPKWHLLVASSTAVVAILLNVLLVPGLGALGAALSTGCAYLLFFALRTVIAQRLFALNLQAQRLGMAMGLFAAACAAHSFAPEAPATYVGTAIAFLACLGLYRTEIGGMLRHTRAKAF